MAVNPVSLPPDMRPWSEAGITHFLSEVLPDHPAYNFAADRAGGKSIAEWGRERPAITGAPSTALDENLSGPASIRSDETPTVPDGSRATAAPAERSHAPCPAACQGASSDDSADDFSPTLWPEPWKRLLRKTPKAAIVWSYPELADDLDGRGLPQRSMLMRTLIGSLQLPRGSSAFWPFRLARREAANEDDAAPTQRIQEEENGSQRDHHGTFARHAAAVKAKEHPHEYFRLGLDEIQPRVVILFGQEAVRESALPLQLSVPFTQQILAGRLFVILPSVQAFIESAALTPKATAFLRPLLAGMIT